MPAACGTMALVYTSCGVAAVVFRSVAYCAPRTDAHRDVIVGALVDLLRPRGVLLRNDPKVRTLEGLPQEEAKKPHGLHGLLVLLPPALLLFYMFAVERLGFIVTAALIVLIAALAFGAKLRLALPLAALAPIGVHLVFYKLLRVPLPAGLVPMPW